MESLTLTQLQQGFNLLLERADPRSVNDFFLWLEIKLTEQKYKGIAQHFDVSNSYEAALRALLLENISQSRCGNTAAPPGHRSHSYPTTPKDSKRPVISPERSTNQNASPSHMNKMNLSPDPGSIYLPHDLLIARQLLAEYSKMSPSSTPPPYLDPYLVRQYYSPLSGDDSPLSYRSQSPSKTPNQRNGSQARVNLSQEFNKITSQLINTKATEACNNKDQLPAKTQDSSPHGFRDGLNNKERLPLKARKAAYINGHHNHQGSVSTEQRCGKCHQLFGSKELLDQHACFKPTDSISQNTELKIDDHARPVQYSPISSHGDPDDPGKGSSPSSSRENTSSPPHSLGTPVKPFLKMEGQPCKESLAELNGNTQNQAIDMSVRKFSLNGTPNEKGLGMFRMGGLLSSKMQTALMEADRIRSYSDSEISPCPGQQAESPYHKRQRKPKNSSSPHLNGASHAQRKLEFLAADDIGANFLATETGTYHVTRTDLDSDNGDETHSVGGTPTKCIKVVKQGNYLKLKKEAQLIDGELRFICPHCSKVFHRSSNFSRHMRIHRGVFSYICSTCARGFYRKEHFDKHKCYRKSMATTWDRKTKVDLEKEGEGQAMDGEDEDDLEQYAEGVKIDGHIGMEMECEGKDYEEDCGNVSMVNEDEKQESESAVLHTPITDEQGT